MTAQQNETLLADVLKKANRDQKTHDLIFSPTYDDVLLELQDTEYWRLAVLNYRTCVRAQIDGKTYRDPKDITMGEAFEREIDLLGGELQFADYVLSIQIAENLVVNRSSEDESRGMVTMTYRNQEGNVAKVRLTGVIPKVLLHHLAKPYDLNKGSFKVKALGEKKAAPAERVEAKTASAEPNGLRKRLAEQATQPSGKDSARRRLMADITKLVDAYIEEHGGAQARAQLNRRMRPAPPRRAQSHEEHLKQLDRRMTPQQEAAN